MIRRRTSLLALASVALRGENNQTTTVADTLPVRADVIYAAKGWLDVDGRVEIGDLLGETSFALYAGATVRGQLF